MTRRAWLACLCAALATGAAAQAEVVVRDDRGVEQRFDTPPRRIVSLLPSATESVCALGACARLVGVDRYSNHPAGVLSLPRLGGLDDAQVERIVALGPDLVLAAKSARVSDRLEALGLRLVMLESDSHADVRRSLQLLAKVLGVPQEAERVWARIQRQIDDAAARVPAELRGSRVYFEVSSSPHAAGASSFIGETLARLGLVNIAPSAMGPFPKLNPEFVVRSRPEIVIASQRELQSMAGRPGWQALLDATLRRCAFPTEHYDLLVRPGPRMGEAALALADCLVHPRAP